MPFSTSNAYPFTRSAIESLAPDQQGVYGLFKTNVWVYIGKGNIRQRLLDHYNGDNPCITREAPTHWIAEPCRNTDEREEDLLREIPTVCNQRIG